MPLTEAQAGVFWPLYDAFQGEMRGIGDRYVDIVARYAATFPAGAEGEVAKGLMQDWLTMQAESIKIRRKYLKQFSKALPTSLVLRFFQIDNKLMTIIRADVTAQIPLN